MLNLFSGTQWPRGVGFPLETIHQPAAIVTTGDNAHDGQAYELGAYQLLYEQFFIQESTAIPVFPGLGNHDVENDCYQNNCAKRMFDYVGEHNFGGYEHIDALSDNYSWDFNGVHFIQLNKWAGDTTLGSGSAGTTHPSGLPWLVSDLHNSVGYSNRPVIIFQHFGVDSFSENGSWWLASDRQAFWGAIKGYNVIGMFTGHIHSTGMYDFYEGGGHLDDFVGGTGGEDPCLNLDTGAYPPNPLLLPCGGRGHFFVIRVTPQFLDVASVEWLSDLLGNVMSGTPYFSNLSYPTSGAPQLNTTGGISEGPAFVGGQLGCRKIINSRIVDVTSSASLSGTGKNGPVTVRSNGANIIPGPLALEFTGLGDSDNLTSKSFVDRCAPAVSSGAAGSDAAGGNSFMYPDNGSTASLTSTTALTFTPTYASNPPANVTLKLVRILPTKGASPTAVSLTGSPTRLPAPTPITFYGPPNMAFTLTNAIANPSTPNWISVPTSGHFDQYGTAVVNYTFNSTVLGALNPQSQTSEVTDIILNTGNPMDTEDVLVTLNLSAPDSITVSYQPQVGSNIVYQTAATLNYTQVVQDGGGVSANGSMTLYDITNPTAPVALDTEFVNSNCDVGSEGCHQEFMNGVYFNVSYTTFGIHALQVSYSGDANYAPNKSAPFSISVGSPKITLTTVPANLQISVDGIQQNTPQQLAETFLTTHTLSVTNPQTATATKYVFTGWSDGVTTPSRSITVNQYTSTYTADFETQYQVTLDTNPANGGTLNEPSSYYPSGAFETLTATPNAGYVFSGFVGDLVSTSNGASLTVNGPKHVTAAFTALIAPVVSWATPASILFGSALGPQQLNATANVAGTFVYSPAAGTVPPQGNGYPLGVTFTPTSTAYSQAKANVLLNVLPAGNATLVITKTLTRDLSSGVITAQVTISNTGTAAANNIVFTSAKIGTTSSSTLPPAIASLAGGQSQTVSLTFPGTAGVAGSSSSLIILGSYTGGSINYSSRIVLP